MGEGNSLRSTENCQTVVKETWRWYFDRIWLLRAFMYVRRYWTFFDGDGLLSTTTIIIVIILLLSLSPLSQCLCSLKNQSVRVKYEHYNTHTHTPSSPDTLSALHQSHHLSESLPPVWSQRVQRCQAESLNNPPLSRHPAPLWLTTRMMAEPAATCCPLSVRHKEVGLVRGQ